MIGGNRVSDGVSAVNLSNYLPGSTLPTTAAKTGANWFRTNDSMTNIVGNVTTETKMSSSHGNRFSGVAPFKGSASPINGGRMTQSTFR